MQTTSELNTIRMESTFRVRSGIYQGYYLRDIPLESGWHRYMLQSDYDSEEMFMLKDAIRSQGFDRPSADGKHIGDLTETTDLSYLIPFGKYKGCYMGQIIDMNYLKWVVKNKNPTGELSVMIPYALNRISEMSCHI